MEPASHGFNIVEVGENQDPSKAYHRREVMGGAKVSDREIAVKEYKRGFGVPCLIAVHPGCDPQRREA